MICVLTLYIAITLCLCPELYKTLERATLHYLLCQNRSLVAWCTGTRTPTSISIKIETTKSPQMGYHRLSKVVSRSPFATSI